MRSHIWNSVRLDSTSPIFRKGCDELANTQLQYSYTTDIAHIYEDILTTAKIKQISGSWISALKFSMFMNKMRFKLKKFPDKPTSALDQASNNT